MEQFLFFLRSRDPDSQILEQVKVLEELFRQNSSSEKNDELTFEEFSCILPTKNVSNYGWHFPLRPDTLLKNAGVPIYNVGIAFDF